MKKMIALLALLGTLPALSAVVPADQIKPAPILIQPFDDAGIGYAEMIYNSDLTNSGTSTDTVIGNVYDIRKLALVRHYDADAATLTSVVDSLIGRVTASCYDISDSSAVTDSVNTRFTIQGADFASNNSDPNTPHSDAWYTIQQFTLNDVSASSAQVTVDSLQIKLPHLTHATQFIRVYGENLSTAAQNDSRCRVYLYRPRWAVQ